MKITHPFATQFAKIGNEVDTIQLSYVKDGQPIAEISCDQQIKFADIAIYPDQVRQALMIAENFYTIYNSL